MTTALLLFSCALSLFSAADASSSGSFTRKAS